MKVVRVGREERGPGVHDQAFQGVAGLGDGLPDQALEGLLSLELGHQGVHHIVGALVHPDEERRLLASDVDRLAVDAKEPAPSRGPELGGDLERRLGAAAESVHPPVQRDPPHRLPKATLEQQGEDPVGGEPLHVETNGFFHDVVGELGAGSSPLPPDSEAASAGLTEEPLQRPQRPAERDRPTLRLPLALGVEAPAPGAADASFVLPSPGPPIRSFTG